MGAGHRLLLESRERLQRSAGSPAISRAATPGRANAYEHPVTRARSVSFVTHAALHWAPRIALRERGGAEAANPNANVT